MHGQLGTSLNFPFPHGVAVGALICFATGMILSSGAAMSQGLDVPVVTPPGDGQMADCATSTVSGLDPAGDNFLAVRSGPGTKHRRSTRSTRETSSTPAMPEATGSAFDTRTKTAKAVGCMGVI